METGEKLHALIELLESVGLEIRRAPLGGEGGGLCTIKGKRVVFVDTMADTATQYDRTLADVASLAELADCHVMPRLREDLDRARSDTE